MAGVMSGVLYAPLTAIFLIAESSSGYDLFIPLMIVSVISFLIAKWFSPISPDLKLLAEKGKIFTREHDKNLLSLLRTTDLIDPEFQSINIHAPFAELLTLVKNGKRNVIAVLDDGKLAGIISLDDLRPVMFTAEMYAVPEVIKLMKAPQVVITTSDNVLTVLKHFDETGTPELPVIFESGEFAGFISKSDVLNKYRKLLQEYS